MNLSTEMKTGDLLAVHNERATAAGAKTLGRWKQSKDKLIERIEALPAPTKKEPAKKEQKAAFDYSDAVARAGVSPHDTIAVASEKLLTQVAFTHDRRPWGIPYAECLAEIRRVFPDADTTVACLRWYVVHMNRDGTKLPFRKRSKAS